MVGRYLERGYTFLCVNCSLARVTYYEKDMLKICYPKHLQMAKITRS